MIHAGKPQHLVALHALTAGQRIHQSVIQGVTHVQAACHIRRRQDDRVRRLGTGGISREVPGINPALIDPGLYRTGLPRLGKSLGAGVISGGHLMIL